MNTLAADSLGLAFVGYIFFGAVVAIVLGRILGLNDRLSREQQAERAEVDGPMTQFAEDDYWANHLAAMQDKQRRVDEVRKRWSA